MEDEGPPRHSPLSRRSFPPFAIISVFLLLVIASSVSLAYAQPMDFSLRSTFKGESLPQGSFDNYNEVNITSLEGFSGYVNLAASISPIETNGPLVSLSIPTVNVPSGGSGYSELVVSTVSDTPWGTIP